MSSVQLAKYGAGDFERTATPMAWKVRAVWRQTGLGRYIGQVRINCCNRDAKMLRFK